MNIYVSNLSYHVNDASLQELFAPFGEVTSAKVILDRATGRSRGFAFVEMSNDDAARAAITALNDTNLEGRNIRVSEAKPREDKPFKPGGGDRNRW